MTGPASTGSKEPDVTILDSRLPQLDERPPSRAADGPAQAGQPATAQNGAQPARDPMARLEALFDPGSVQMLVPADDSGVLTAEGLIEDMPAVAFASDPKYQGGALGAAGCASIVLAYDRALEIGAPVFGLWHSG